VKLARTSGITKPKPQTSEDARRRNCIESEKAKSFTFQRANRIEMFILISLNDMFVFCRFSRYAAIANGENIDFNDRHDFSLISSKVNRMFELRPAPTTCETSDTMLPPNVN
jgi:hypothetical protein